MSKINKDMINAFLQDLLSKYSESYVSSIKIFLLAMLNYAYKENIISEKVNGIIKIKVPKTKIEILTDTEQQRLEDYLMSNLNSINLGILLVLFTGIRIGEICSLMVYDLELDTGYLNINKTLQRVKNLEENAKTKTKIIIDTPKSDSSIRTIPLPNFLIEMIEKVTKDFNKNSFFLTGSIHKFIEPRTLENKYKKILENCKIEYRNFHTLRHSFASNCLIKNYYDYKTLSEILGHSNPTITLKKYVHSNNFIKSEQVKRIDNDFISRINSCTNIEKVL